MWGLCGVDVEFCSSVTLPRGIQGQRCAGGAVNQRQHQGLLQKQREENGCLINKVALCLTFCVLSNILRNPATESDL